MSLLIELAETPELDSREEIKLMLRSIFRSQMFICKNAEDNGRQLTFWLRGSQNTYNLSTCWKFTLVTQTLLIEVSIYNIDGDDILRARTSRMKIEASILIRIVNNHIRMVNPNIAFILDHQSGALKLTHSLPMFYKAGVKKQDVLNIIKMLFTVLHNHKEIITFLQPQFNMKQLSEKQKLEDPRVRINRLRYILRNTPNRCRQLNDIFFNLNQLKLQNREITFELINNLGVIYHNNVLELQSSQIGLEGSDQYEICRQSYALELAEKQKHEKAKPTAKNKQLDKILFGITEIEPLNKQKISKENNKEQQGAHSEIHSKQFRYYVADTIHAGALSEHMGHRQHVGKKKEGRLTYKVCNTETEASVNSFKNELAFLRHVRDMANPYIARYFLLVKESWDERDTIYMTTYQQNVYSLVTNRKTLGVRAKLQLAYRITKSLCFLFSKKIAHRDFKPQNVVVDSMLTPKLIDFGSCVAHFSPNPAGKKFKPHDERLLSTPNYQVYYNSIVTKFPEFQMKYSKKSFDQHPLFDVFSFGKTLNFIFFGDLNLPHPQSLKNEPLHQVLEHIVFLIQLCLSIDPDDRPSFGEITSFIGALNDLITKVLKTSSDDENV